MTHQKNTHKHTKSVNLPLAYQLIPTGGGTTSGAGGFNTSNLSDMLNQSTAASLNSINQQQSFMNDMANRNLSMAMYQNTLGNILGATQVGTQNMTPKATNFGPMSGSGGGGGVFA
jgi:hypothetical protein